VDVLEGANFSQLKSGYLLKDDGTVHAAVTLTGGMRASGVEYITSARLGSGNDTVAFTTVRDNPFIMTGDGDDTINGGRGQDYVDGGGGSDVLVVDYSGNTFDGTSSYSAGMTMGVSASYLPEEDRYENYGSASAYRAVSAQDYVSFYHIERFDVRGTPAVDNVYGGFGDDTLSGNGGNDTLRGGAGSDSLVGGSGSDLIEGDAGDDTLDGGDGDDSFKSGWASSDAVLQTGWIEGGSGVDTLEGANFSQLKSGYLLKDDGTVHAAVTLAGGMRASGLEYITSGRLGSGNDTVAFTTVRDNPFIETGDGDDTINGGRGQDNVDGGGGIDVLVVDYSGNTFAGTSSYSAGMTLNVGSSYLQSEDRNDNYGSASAFRSVGLQDSVSFSHIERLDVKGTPAADALNGGSGSDTLSGNGGNDTLRGGAGADSLVGGSGTDLMEGNEGDDTLCVDGAAAATVAGGAGRDVLRFTNYTVIPAVVFSDFEPGAGGDIVDASALVKGFKGYTGGNPFTGGYLKVVQSGADALLQFGADGNKTAAYKTLVRFSGVSAAKLVSENFLPSSALFVDETPVGNSGNDSASGNTGKNLLEGGSGDDTLSGLAGDDTLIGGEGDDSLNGGSGNDSILGGLGNDVLESGDGIDIIDGGSGTDYLSVDWLKFSKARIEGSFQQSGSGAGASFSGFYAAKDAGGAVLSSVKFSGIENLTINAKAIDLTAGAVSPTAVPGVSLHRVSASALTSEQGGKVEYDVALRKAPKDTVKVQFTVSDTTEGKLSARELVFNATDWNKPKRLTVVGVDDYLDDGNIAYNVVGKIVTGDLTYNRVTVPSLNLVNNDDAEDAPLVFKGSRDVDYFQGKNGNDRIYGGLDQDKLLGGRGDDKIYGEEDDDRLFGEGGNDKLYGFYDDDLLDGGEGDDSLFGEQGLDTLVGGLGNDYLDGGLENDSMAGGAGNDTYFVDSAGDKIRDLGLSSDMDKVVLTMAISYLLPEGVESAGMATSGEASLTGNALNNRLSGNDARNGLSGGLGNDSLDGGAGADSLAGGEGDDLMAGGAGNDTLRGGAGVDWADFAAAGVDVKVDLASGKCFGDGADLLFEIENVLAGDGADTLIGSAGANSLEGGAGSDSLSGGEGDDTLAGCFYGKDGGRGSVDTLLGGGGGDLFELGWVGGRFYDDGNAQSGGREDYALITDFTVGKDRLQLDGAAKDYFLGASGVSGVAGTGLFWDGNANGKLDTSDELIAIVRPAGGTTLDAAGVVAKAVFV
jgi:Ca2+-binding RTX toxin-like protein